MKSPEKRKTAPQLTTELHFVADVPLSESLEWLTQLPDHDDHLTLTELSPDVYRFVLSRRRAGEVEVDLEGTIRRWQGTMTRIDCDTRLPQDRLFRRRDVQAIAIFGGIYALFMLVVGGLLAGIVVALLVAFVLMMQAINGNTSSDPHLSNEQRKQRFQARREADALLNALIAVFRERTSVQITEAPPADGMSTAAWAHYQGAVLSKDKLERASDDDDDVQLALLLNNIKREQWRNGDR